jgi:hypothetical protein
MERSGFPEAVGKSRFREIAPLIPETTHHLGIFKKLSELFKKRGEKKGARRPYIGRLYGKN